jgi:hypothetical protein
VVTNHRPDAGSGVTVNRGAPDRARRCAWGAEPGLLRRWTAAAVLAGNDRRWQDRADSRDREGHEDRDRGEHRFSDQLQQRPTLGDTRSGLGRR